MSEFLREHYFAVVILSAIGSGEYFSFRLSPPPAAVSDWVITVAMGVPMAFFMMIPCLFIFALLYSALGWMD